MPDEVPEFSDKILHILAYTVLTLLSYNYFKGLLKANAIIFSALFSGVYGIIIEVLQRTLNPERSFDLLDIGANIVGVGIAVILILSFKDKVKIQ